MCGIGGILRTDGRPIPEEWLDAIDARIAYRGPDGCGRFRDRVEVDTPAGKKVVEVAFVHRRLSIIDHEDGAQPMVSDRGRSDEEGLVAVVFNGCIYNHRELRKELQASGHKFVSDHSDTEVLIHGWREWGEEIIRHLEGMYAFALWDRSAATLLLGRDRYGEKPLYLLAPYDEEDGPPDVGPFMFGSDAGSLARIADVFPPNESQLRHWSTSYLRTGTAWIGRTCYLQGDGDLVNLEPGNGWRYDAKTVGRLQYGWPWPMDPPSEGPTYLEPLLDCAIAARLEADVPLGCFLSGGVDSSLMTFYAKKHKPDLRTFSVKMPDPRYDESRYAERVAQMLGTDHTTLQVDPHPAEDLVFLIETLGQPFGDSSILPTYWVSKAASQHVKVALSGDGGDELFLGYERYLAVRFLARYHKWLRLVPLGSLRRSHPKSRLNKLARLREMARDFPRLGIRAMKSIFNQAEIAELLGDAHPALWTPPPDGEPLTSLRMDDLIDYLPNDLLTKVDTASMACALEVRCPFLDRDLASAVLAMPIDDLIPGGKRKGLLRNIARKYLPKEVVDRPKMGFAIPIGEWFRSDYGGMKTLLMDHLASAEPFGPISLNRKAVQRFIDEHMAGKYDHSLRLFTLLTLSIWAKSLGD